MSSREIRRKIRSIENTKKITRAMEMISASKMRKLQARMSVSRPYAKGIFSVIRHVAKSHSEYRHSYMQARPVKRVGFIIVSSDRGLCGGFNLNLFRVVLKEMQSWQEKGVGIDVCIFGTKAESFFRRVNASIVASKTHLGDMPLVKDIIGAVKVMLDKYDNQEVDALYLVHNEFVSTVKQQPMVKQLLPLLGVDEELDHYWDYIYEPDARELLDRLLTRYMESQVYQGVIENIACEQAARMLAMKNASDNAGEIINELLLAYNKARQAAITKELSEIVAGAEAV